MTDPNKLLPKFQIVKDFAIERDPYRLVFVGERLGASAEIQHAKPSVD